jgi:hypothetical protein
MSHDAPAFAGLEPGARAAGLRHHAAAAVTAGRGGNSEDAKLAELKRRYRRWWIWRGHVTGECWALPPRGHPTQRELISASDADQLAQRLAEVEGRQYM